MTEPGPARVDATGRWTDQRRVALATAVVVLILARTLYIDGVLDARDGVRASTPSA